MPRSFFIGVNQAVTAAFQWHESTDGWASNVTRIAPPAATQGHLHAVAIINSSLRERGCTSEDGTKFFYPGVYTAGAVIPIRMWDSDTSTDTLLANISVNSQALSDNGSGQYALRGGAGVRHMINVGRKLYLACWDFNWNGGSNSYGRVMEIDLDTLAVTQVGNNFSGWSAPNPVAVGSTSSGGSTGGSSGAPFCLAWHNAQLWVGYGVDGSNTNSIECGIYRITPGGPAWLSSYLEGGADMERITCMMSFNGELYAGFEDTNGNTSHIRALDGGAWTTVRSITGTVSSSAWTDMCVFDGSLYACSYVAAGNNSLTQVHKFDGATWSIVKTLDGPTPNPKIAVGMVVADETLFIYARNASQVNILVTKSLDGTAWTDFTFSSGSPNNTTSVFGGAGSAPPPDVEAGPDQDVSIPGAEVQFDAEIVGEDNFPVPATFLWTFVSGPVTINPATAFDDDTILNPTWQPTVPGVYVFRITADDTEATDFDDVQITVTQLPEPVFSVGDGRVSHPLTWLEMTDREDNKKVFSEVDLNDPEWYFGGYKYPWVLQFRTISRGLSDRNGQPEHMSFGATLSDVERHFRTQLAHPINRYITNRPLTVRMIDDEDRRQQLNPMVAAVGYVSDYSPKQDFKFDLVGTDWIKRKFSRKAKAALAWQPTISVADFPTADTDIIGQTVPIIYGYLNGENLVTEVVPGVPIPPTLPPSGTLPDDDTIDAPTQARAGDLVQTKKVGIDGRVYMQVCAVKDGKEGQLSNKFSTVANKRGFWVTWNTVPGVDGYRIFFWDKESAFNPRTVSGPTPDHAVFVEHNNNTQPCPNEGQNRPSSWSPRDHEQVALKDGWGSSEAHNLLSTNTGDPEFTDPTTIIVDRGHGKVPVIHVGTEVIAATTWQKFLVCGHAVKSIDGWYLNGARQDVTTANAGGDWLIPGYPNWDTQFGGGAATYKDINGRRYTIIYAKGDAGLIGSGESPEEAGDSPQISGNDFGQVDGITLNVQGVETVGDGSGDLIRTPAAQCLHFLNNYLAPETPYASGAYLTAADSVFEHEVLIPLVDEDSFTQAELDAAERVTNGYETAGIIGSGNEKTSAMEVLSRFNVSGDFDSTFTRKGQYAISMEPLSQETSALTVLDDVISIVDRSFEITDLVQSEFFNILPYSANRDYIGETQGGWGVDTDKRSDISIELYEQERESSRYELNFGRTETTQMANTVADVMTRKLNRYRNPRRRATLTVPFSGIPYQPGSIATITHVEGIGAEGWVNHDVRIVRQEIDATAGQVKLDVYDLEQLFETMGLWAPEDTPERAASTDVQKSRYMYWADEVDLFYSDGAPVKTWT